MAKAMCVLGRCRGKAVAARWRVPGGAEHFLDVDRGLHEMRSETAAVVYSLHRFKKATTKGLTGHYSIPILTRIATVAGLMADWKVGRLGRCPGRQNLWLDAVAVARGISGEVSLAVAAGDLNGACILHAPVFLEVV